MPLLTPAQAGAWLYLAGTDICFLSSETQIKRLDPDDMDELEQLDN